VTAAAAILISTNAAPQDAPFVERVEVARILIDARVVDDRGAPIADLGPADFVVRIGQHEARVESAEWVGRAPQDARVADNPHLVDSPPPEQRVVGPSPEPAGRLVVVLVQKDLEPFRMVGLMRLSWLADRLLETLTPDDRIAVLSFDSRLRLWMDFTNDFARVRAVLRDDLLVRRPGPVTRSEGVSLLARLGEQSAARTHRIEDALRRVAEALEPLPGAKSVVLFGYGFGRLMMSGVIMMHGYEEAAAALKRARAAVFTLNVTEADYNSLQAGLQSVSEETGGLYASLYAFPMQAIRRVTHALTGHYVLFVERPDLPRGAHRIEVRLASRRGRVVAGRGLLQVP
jgi:VWFA-related protein